MNNLLLNSTILTKVLCFATHIRVLLIWHVKLLILKNIHEA